MEGPQFFTRPLGPLSNLCTLLFLLSLIFYLMFSNSLLHRHITLPESLTGWQFFLACKAPLRILSHLALPAPVSSSPLYVHCLPAHRVHLLLSEHIPKFSSNVLANCHPLRLPRLSLSNEVLPYCKVYL